MKKWLLFSLLVFSTGMTAQTGAAYDGLTPQEAATMANEGLAIIIDVREAHELQDGMADGALWMATSNIEAHPADVDAFIANLDPSLTIAVYCASGRRAQRFVDLLLERGFQAENIGGFDDWVNAGLPTTKPPM